MANLKSDDIKKMIDALNKSMPPVENAVDAILFTGDWIIPQGVMLKAEHDGKKYLMMSKLDVDRAFEEIKRTTPPSVIYQTGYIGVSSLAGIPVIEDTEKIREIMGEVARKHLESMWQELIKPIEPEVQTSDFRFTGWWR